MTTEPQRVTTLVVRARRRLCALPVEDVGETMRPLPTAAVPGAPGYVLGVAMIRGAPTPVVDLGALLSAGPEPLEATRFVTLGVRQHGRALAIAVEAVLGVRVCEAGALGALPPLFAGGAHPLVEALGAHQRELLLFLKGGRLLPEEDWRKLAPREAARA